MSLDDPRLLALNTNGEALDTPAALQEIEADLVNATRFPFGPLGEFALALRAHAKETMTAKDRDLFRVMTTLGTGCENCIADALVSVIRRGATRLEVKRALVRGVMMAEKPALIFAGEALAHFDAVGMPAERLQADRSNVLAYKQRDARNPDAAA